MTHQKQLPTSADARMHQVSPDVLMHLLGGMMMARCIFCAARFHLATLVQHGPKSLHELAQASGTYAPSLYRILRALASIGMFEEVMPATFAQTDLSSLLLPGVPGSMYEIALMWGADYQWNSWGAIEVALITGTCAFEHVHQTDVQTYLSQVNPAEGEIFSRAMTAMSKAINEPLVAAYDFSSFQYVVDVGGGQGSVLPTILIRHPSIMGVIFDRPAAVEEVRASIESFATGGATMHCDVVAGDFFEDVPVEADAYLLKHILHHWPDDACITLLNTCRQAMRPDGRILVIEQVLRLGRTTFPSSIAPLLDVQMMVMSAHGRERTENEYRTLFEAAGLRLARVVPTTSLCSILEGIVA